MNTVQLQGNYRRFNCASAATFDLTSQSLLDVLVTMIGHTVLVSYRDHIGRNQNSCSVVARETL